MSDKKHDTSTHGWPKAAVVLVLALAATSQVGNIPNAPTQRPATTCITLRA